MMGVCTVGCKEQLQPEETAATKVEGSAGGVWGEGARRWRQLLHNLTLPLLFPSSFPLLCSGRGGRALSFPKQQHLDSLVLLKILDSAVAEVPLV